MTEGLGSLISSWRWSGDFQLSFMEDSLRFVFKRTEQKHFLKHAAPDWINTLFLCVVMVTYTCSIVLNYEHANNETRAHKSTVWDFTQWYDSANNATVAFLSKILILYEQFLGSPPSAWCQSIWTWMYLRRLQPFLHCVSSTCQAKHLLIFF